MVIQLEITTPIFIFQTGNVLELEDTIVEETMGKAKVKGYYVPDTGEGEPGIIPQDHVRIIEAEKSEATEFFGKCVLTKVSNFYKDREKDPEVGKAEIGIVEKYNVQVVHYPDCQQLFFHMPKYAWDAGNVRLTEDVTHQVLYDQPVRDKLNGSTMILWDTLPLKPGFYTLEANWPDGWTHQLRFIKFIPGYPREEVYKHPPGNVTVIQNDQEYRTFDSNGVEILDGISQKREDIFKKFFEGLRHLEYDNRGRGGYVIYCEGDIRISFDFEFAGGKGVVLIFVPTPAQWELATGTPLAERDSILTFVAEQAIRDQAPDCIYEISDNCVEILYP